MVAMWQVATILDNSGLECYFSFCTDLFFFFLWGGACLAACGILVPQPGIEPGPLALRAQSPNHWTAREFPDTVFLIPTLPATHPSFKARNGLYSSSGLPSTGNNLHYPLVLYEHFRAEVNSVSQCLEE